MNWRRAGVFALFLVTCALPSVAAAEDFKERAFLGLIGPTLRVEMTLTRHGEALSGTYCYLRAGKAGPDLRVAGTIDASGTLHLTETDSKGARTEAFDGTLDAVGLEMSGVWSSPRGERKLAFSLCGVHALAEWIEVIPADPDRAAARLRTLGTPTANAYLAYLYFTGKAKVPNPKAAIARLIDQALADVEVFDDHAFTSPARDHAPFLYATLGDLLDDVRRISEVDRTGAALDDLWPFVSFPCWLVREHPHEAVHALGLGWGNRRDTPVGLCRAYGSILDLDGVGRFVTLVDEIEEKRFDACDGSIRFSIDRGKLLMDMVMSLAPRALLDDEQALARHLGVQMRNLEVWSNETAWKKNRYTALASEIPGVTARFAAHYERTFHMTPPEAERAARAAIATIFIRLFSDTNDEEDWRRLDAATEKMLGDQVYRAFTDRTLDVARTTSLLSSSPFAGAPTPPDRASGDEKRPLDRALQLAVVNGLPLDIIRLLLDRSARPDVGQDSALMLAVERPDVVRLLLDAGANPNHRNAFGKSALHAAAELDQPESVRILLDRGARANDAMKDFQSLCEEWSEKQLSINYCEIAGETSPEGKFTPLMYAARQASLPIIELLVQHGADVGAQAEHSRRAQDFIDGNDRLSKVDREKAKRFLAPGVRK